MHGPTVNQDQASMGLALKLVPFPAYHPPLTYLAAFPSHGFEGSKQSLFTLHLAYPS